MKKADPPWIQTVSLAPPTLKDNTADTDRLVNALKSRLKSEAITIDLELMRQLPRLLRESQYKVHCILFKDRNQYFSTTKYLCAFNSR